MSWEVLSLLCLLRTPQRVCTTPKEPLCVERVDPKKDATQTQPWSSASWGRGVHWRYLTDMGTVNSEQP